MNFGLSPQKIGGERGAAWAALASLGRPCSHRSNCLETGLISLTKSFNAPRCTLLLTLFPFKLHYSKYKQFSKAPVGVMTFGNTYILLTNTHISRKYHISTKLHGKMYMYKEFQGKK